MSAEWREIPGFPGYRSCKECQRIRVRLRDARRREARRATGEVAA